MKRICVDCNNTLGHKEPYEDHRISHGLCRGCDVIRWNRFLKNRTPSNKRGTNGNTQDDRH